MNTREEIEKILDKHTTNLTSTHQEDGTEIISFDKVVFNKYEAEKELYKYHLQSQLELLEEIKCQTEIKVTEPPKDIKKLEKRQAWMAGQINVLCNYTELLDSKILSIKKEMK